MVDTSPMDPAVLEETTLAGLKDPPAPLSLKVTVTPEIPLPL